MVASESGLRSLPSDGPVGHEAPWVPPPWPPGDPVNLMAGSSGMECNATCCNYSGGFICFIEYNFTDYQTLDVREPWEVAVRWTYTILIVLVGLLGNLAIITILIRNRLLMRSTINLFILNLSIADLITLAVGPIPFTIRETHPFWVLGPVWCHLDGFIQMIVMLVSVTTLSTISFDRMVGVLFPFHRHLRIWEAVGVIALIWAAAIPFATPFAIYRNYFEREWKDLTEVTCEEVQTKLYPWWIVVVIALTWLPLLVMLVCYTVIFVQVYRQSSCESLSPTVHPAILSTRTRVVKMMFVVVLVFLACWLPFQILKIAKPKFISETGQLLTASRKTYKVWNTISQYVLYINPTVNPLIYGLMHQNYRRAFKVTFPWIFKGKPAFVLTRGNGNRPFVWSTTRSRSHTIHSTPSSSNSEEPRVAAVNAMALRRTKSLDTERFETRRRQAIRRTQREDFSRRTNEFPMHRISHSKTKKNKRVKSPAGRGTEPRGEVNITVVLDEVPRETSLFSTNSLGALIHEVIEEESQSEVERETSYSHSVRSNMPSEESSGASQRSIV